MIFFFFSIDAKIKKKNPAARTCHGHSRTEINTVPHEHKTPVIDSHTAALVVSRATSPAGRRGRELVRRRPGCRGGQTHACARRRRAAGRSAAGEVSMPRQAGKEVAAGACTSTEKGRAGCPSRLPAPRAVIGLGRLDLSASQATTFGCGARGAGNSSRGNPAAAFQTRQKTSNKCC